MNSFLRKMDRRLGSVGGAGGSKRLGDSLLDKGKIGGAFGVTHCRFHYPSTQASCGDQRYVCLGSRSSSEAGRLCFVRPEGPFTCELFSPRSHGRPGAGGPLLLLPSGSFSFSSVQSFIARTARRVAHYRSFVGSSPQPLVPCYVLADASLISPYPPHRRLCHYPLVCVNS